MWLINVKVKELTVRDFKTIYNNKEKYSVEMCLAIKE